MTGVARTSESHSESNPQRSIFVTASVNSAESAAPPAPRPTPIRIFIRVSEVRLQWRGYAAGPFSRLRAADGVRRGATGPGGQLVSRGSRAARCRATLSNAARRLHLRSLRLWPRGAGHGPGGLWRRRRHARPAASDAHVSGDMARGPRRYGAAAHRPRGGGFRPGHVWSVRRRGRVSPVERRRDFVAGCGWPAGDSTGPLWPAARPRGQWRALGTLHLAIRRRGRRLPVPGSGRAADHRGSRPLDQPRAARRRDGANLAAQTGARAQRLIHVEDLFEVLAPRSAVGVVAHIRLHHLPPAADDGVIPLAGEAAGVIALQVGEEGPSAAEDRVVANPETAQRFQHLGPDFGVLLSVHQLIARLEFHHKCKTRHVVEYAPGPRPKR